MAVEAIKAVREVIDDDPLLWENGSQLDENPSDQAMLERERREEGTELYRELSKYYRPARSVCWSRPKLLARGKKKPIRCTVDIPLTHSLISGTRFRDQS